MLIDSHCHLNLLDLTSHHGDLSKVIDAAQASGVGHMLCVCVDLDTYPAVLHIANTYPNVTATFGLHPTEKISEEPSFEELITLADHSKVIGIGETGLDYYHVQEECEWQRDRFRNFIRLAKTTKKPLIVHSRQAREDTIRLLKEENAETIGGVLHCFTENWEMAKQAMDLGFYISFSGIVTFKNAQELKEVAKRVPLDRMLIETDAPYLAPVPFRGKPNEPAYVKYVAEHIAELRQVPFETIAEHTTQNFFRLFNITDADVS